MLAPAGSSQRSTSQSKSSEGGETERRRKPVAGSTNSGWSARATSAGASASMSARRRETVEPCAAGEAAEHRGCRAHVAVLDSAQRGAADPAPRRKLVERPAPRAPQFAQPLGEAQVGGVAGQGLGFHKWKILSKERASRDLTHASARRFARGALLLHTAAFSRMASAVRPRRRPAARCESQSRRRIDRSENSRCRSRSGRRLFRRASAASGARRHVPRSAAPGGASSPKTAW